MPSPPPLIERAYELATTGTIGNVAQLISALTREGYENVEMHFQGGTSLRRDLTKICRDAWAKAGHPPVARSDQIMPKV